jgi:release factor glutamine methyltransferase
VRSPTLKSRGLDTSTPGGLTRVEVQSRALAATAPTDPKLEKKDRWTLLDVLRWTTARFEDRGLDTPRLDAEILIASALTLPRVQLYVQFERPLDVTELALIREHVRRRQHREPVAYIVGHKEFFGLDFTVDRRVLIPRPDTETLVDEALARLRERGGVDVTPPRIADVGTGSGAIVICLGKQHPGANLFAVDSAPGSLEIARANAARHGVAVTFLQGDLAQPLLPHGPFDLIVANLPYVPTAQIGELAPEIQTEPSLALDGGADGLDLVRRLIAAAPALLTPGGVLALEIGHGQAVAAAALFQASGLGDLRLRRDLGAVDRVVSAVRP